MRADVPLALTSTTCAAISTALKHHSTTRRVPELLGGRIPPAVAQVIANPVFALALVVDALAITFQVLALRVGEISTVQPILTIALVLSLLFNHLIARTRISRAEVEAGGTLVLGLVVFLIASGATSPHGGAAQGDRIPGLILGGISLVTTVGLLAGTRNKSGRIRARAMAVVVSAVYATTAGLMKSCSRIFSYGGLSAVLASWQLWLLLVVAAFGLFLTQRAFAAAPLHVSLPVIATLDPLFSVALGIIVYEERLRATPLALLGDTVGLILLVIAVRRLTLLETTHDAAVQAAKPTV